ncbi:sensor histidine kinase [Sphingobacterium spiritivorum]|uniref:sensor histidine kinase n=1 Tax=Sphingobacterium spiritivorum TaxID=258 RepID=UPI003DA2DC71
MKAFLKSLLLGIVISAGISLLFSAYYLITFGNLDIQFYKSRGAQIGMIYGVMGYMLNSNLAAYIHSKVPNDNHWRRRLSYFIPGSILVTVLMVFVVNCFFQVIFGELSFTEFLLRQHLGTYIMTTLIALVVGLGFYAFYFYKAYKNAQIQKQKQIAGNATAQFESLKNQIDPHFLFNSLNVLTGLIEESPEKAVDFTTSLSRIYRYVLEQKDKELVPAQQELKFAQIFLNLLRLRFEEALVVEIDDSYIEEEENIIPLSLQLLIENAIKHNVVSTVRKLHIRIVKKDKHLYVSNNLQPKETLGESTGIGLRNIINRYHLLTTEEVIINDQNGNFEVGLPLLAIKSKL